MVGRPGKYATLFGGRQEEVNSGLFSVGSMYLNFSILFVPEKTLFLIFYWTVHVHTYHRNLNFIRKRDVDMEWRSLICLYLFVFKFRSIQYFKCTFPLRLNNKDFHFTFNHNGDILLSEDVNFITFSFQCEAGGCLIELCIQLAIIMTGKQLIVNNIVEILIP